MSPALPTPGFAGIPLRLVLASNYEPVIIPLIAIAVTAALIALIGYIPASSGKRRALWFCLPGLVFGGGMTFFMIEGLGTDVRQWLAYGFALAASVGVPILFFRRWPARRAPRSGSGTKSDDRPHDVAR